MRSLNWCKIRLVQCLDQIDVEFRLIQGLVQIDIGFELELSLERIQLKQGVGYIDAQFKLV